MSKLSPRKYITIKGLEDIETTRNLPLAVVIQRKNDIVVYRVDSKDAQSYFEAWDDKLIPSFESVENATKKFGKTISPAAFLRASVFPAQTGSSLPEGNEFAVYRAKFNGEKQKNS